MKLTDLKIGSRLYIGFGMVAAILVILVSVASVNFKRLSTANEWNTHTYVVRDEVKGVLESLLNIESGQRGFSLTGADASLEPLNAGVKSFAEHLNKARELTADNAAQQDRLRKLSEAQQRWMANAIEPALALRRAVRDGSRPVQDAVAFEQAGRGKAEMDGMRAVIAQIDTAESSLLEQRAKDAAALQTLTAATLIGGGLIAIALAVMLALWLSRNITRPLAQAIALARKVADGDLSTRIVVASKDETGQLIGALKDMNDGLVRIVTGVRQGTDTIATASSEISSGNLELSARTEEQAASLEQTASSMEELTSTVQQNTTNAREADRMAQEATDVAGTGGAVVNSAVQTMEAINESSRRIVDIIGVIDGIAFQTNILALNAAVEAARAGEQGRGFAVVASEVRSLAQRSASAAKEIKQLIGDSVEKVQSGSRLVNEAGQTMSKVVDSVRRVGHMIGDISMASDEQRAGIEQVNQAVVQMDQVTQQNAALVEEAAAASQSLLEQAQKLAQMVGVFRLPVEHGATAAMQETPLTPAGYRGRRHPPLLPTT
ncbi:methyl-accepting chemotaxis protein [Herbaspirillum robiniae]|uniref:methyl-accepting chemotaxis protein n=1 Tax=Herbaspirillum robiniae TaxID=2014887 RepID=UPI003D77A933